MECICFFAESQLYGIGKTPQEAFENLSNSGFANQDEIKAEYCSYYQLGKQISVDVKLVITERPVITVKGKLP